MNGTNRKVFAWRPTLLVGSLSLLLLATLSPCRDLFAAGSTQLPTMGLTSADYALDLVGGTTPEDGLPCCHSSRIRQDVMNTASVVPKERSPQLDSVVHAAPVAAQRIVEPVRDWQQAYHAPTSSLPLYLRFKQLLI